MEMGQLQEMITTDSIKQRDPVFLSGEPNRWVYFLKEGVVKLAITSREGRTITLALLKPGEVFGELTSDDTTEESLEAIALEDSYMCRIRSDVFQAYVAERPGLALSLNKLLGLRIQKIQTAIRDLAFLDVPGRLAKLLHELSQTHSTREPKGIRIQFRLTHQEIAYLIGASREMITNVIGKFEKEGLLIQEKRRFILPDPNRLKKLYS